jgi:hypothetical protein
MHVDFNGRPLNQHRYSGGRYNIITEVKPSTASSEFFTSHYNDVCIESTIEACKHQWKGGAIKLISEFK